MPNAVNTLLVCPKCNTLNRVPSQKLADKPQCGKCKAALIDGHPIAADDKNFGQFILKSDLPVVVDFWASWCGPCKQFAPVFSQVAAEMVTQASFVKLDTEANQQTAAKYQIRSIPTLMVFYHGKEIARLSGALPKSQFTQWLQQQLATIQR